MRTGPESNVGSHALWPPLVLCAACYGSDENLTFRGADAGIEGESAPIDARPADARLEDRGPLIDLDALLRDNAIPLPDRAGEEPEPTPNRCNPEAGAGKPPDTNDDLFGVDGCRPTPARFIILGDSIATGFQEDSLLVTRLRVLAPNAVFQSFAVDGSKIGDLPVQARRAAPGAGHVFVWIWSIGNDMLSGGILAPDADLAPRHAAFAEVFDYFGDPGRFSSGATFLLNTQFDPYDNCEAPGASPWAGPVVMARFLDLNRIFFLDVAEARPDTIAIDQYPDFLGHGRNANIEGCPYCSADNTRWTDGVGFHPNETGRAHVADKWAVAFARMLGASCAR
jgi:hypothetical protein